MIDPIEAKHLRRSADAVRNLIDQVGSRAQWCDWVPGYLDQLADTVAGRPRPDEFSAPVVGSADRKRASHE
jgi:hypothetical protein